MDLGLLSAFAGGILTLLSPCSAMLLPAFFAYAFDDPRTLIARTGVFYLGLITTLVPLGVLAGSLGTLVNEHRYAIVVAASVLVVLMGMMMLFAVPMPFLNRGFQSSGVLNTSSVYLLGTVYGLAGTCAGPLLGAVLAVAALGGNPLYGGVALLLFAAGMALPLLILALVWRRFPGVKKLVRPRGIQIGRWRNTLSSIIGGTLMIVVGVILILTEGTATISSPIGVTRLFHLESEVMRYTEGVPNALIYAVLAVAALVAVVLIARASERNTDR